MILAHAGGFFHVHPDAFSALTVLTVAALVLTVRALARWKGGR